jgi:Xaa-Pro aminopeptidase
MLPLDRHEKYLVPRDDLLGRITSFQARMANAGVDLSWIDHPIDRHYFTGTSQDGTLLLPVTGEPVFFVRRSFQRAEAESPLPVRKFAGRKAIIAAAQEMLPAAGKLGLAFDVTPTATYLWLNKSLPDAELVDINMALRWQKSVKTAWEILQLREAGRIAEIIFSEIPEFHEVGISELEFSSRIEQRLRGLGHPNVIRIRRPGLALATICAVSGDGGLYPTNFDGPVGGEAPYPPAPAGAGWKRLQADEMVMLDMVTVYNGYHSDNARTYFAGGGEFPAAAQEAHETCCAAMALIEKGMRPGVDCTALFREAQSYVDGRGEPEGFMGYGDNRVKFFGHGIGLELDEFPVITAKLEMTLEAGMIIAVEPKAFLKGIGPVGVENTYLITENGAETLCGSPREIVRL